MNVSLLRERITTAGYTNARLAELMNVNPGTISNILTNKNKPSYDVMEQFITHLQIDPISFIMIFFPQLLLNSSLLEALVLDSVTHHEG